MIGVKDFELIGLPCDVPVWYMHMPGWIESAAVSFAMFVGSGDDLKAGKPGVYHWFEHIPFRGTAKFSSSDEVTQPITRHAGEVNAYTNKVATVYHLHVPLKILDVALDRVADMLIAPLLRPADLDAERKIIRKELLERESDIGKWLYDNSGPLLYGPDHPFSHRIGGTWESLQSMTHDELLRVHTMGYSRWRLVVVAASSLLPGAMLEKLTPYIRAVPEGQLTQQDERRRAAFYGEADPWPTGQIERYPWPFSGSSASLGFRIPYGTYRDQCRWNFFTGVLNGGGTSAPLSKLLREERTLVYGANASAGFSRELSRFAVSAQVEFEDVDTVIDSFWEVLEDPNLVNPERIEFVRDMYRGGVVMRTKKPSALANSALSEIVDHGRCITDQEFLDTMLSFDVDELRTLQAQLTRDKARPIILSDKH